MFRLISKHFGEYKDVLDPQIQDQELLLRLLKKALLHSRESRLKSIWSNFREFLQKLKT